MFFSDHACINVGSVFLCGRLDACSLKSSDIKFVLHVYKICILHVHVKNECIYAYVVRDILINNLTYIYRLEHTLT